MTKTTLAMFSMVFLWLAFLQIQHEVLAGPTDDVEKLDAPTLESLDRLHDLARVIETMGETNADILADDTDQTKLDLVYKFLRPSKMVHADFIDKKNKEKADEFQKKAYELSRPKSLVSGLFNWGTERHLRLIAKGEPLLDELVDKCSKRSEQKANYIGGNFRLVVDCDVTKFLMNKTEKILYVAETEVKYLIVEDQATVNRAIFDGLRASKFQSKSNFCNLHELNETQKERIRDFYSAYVRIDDISVQEAIDHLKAPAEYFLSRLFETCSTVTKFDRLMAEYKRDATNWCPKSGLFESMSSADLQQQNQQVEGDLKQHRDVLQLCHYLLLPL